MDATFFVSLFLSPKINKPSLKLFEGNFVVIAFFAWHHNLVNSKTTTASNIKAAIKIHV